MPRGLGLVCAAVGFALAGCDCTTNAKTQVYTCSVKSDCADHFMCSAGVCVPEAGTGGGAASGGGTAANGGGGAGGGANGGGAPEGGGSAGGSAMGGGSAGGTAMGGGSAGGSSMGGGPAGGSAMGGGPTGGGGSTAGGSAGGGATGGGSTGGSGGGAMGGGSAMGGGDTGGGPAGGGSTGGGVPCNASVLVATSNVTQTGLVNDGTLRLMYVGSTAGQPVLAYGECISGCGGQSPMFATTPLTIGSSNPPPEYATLASLPGGGAAIAVEGQGLLFYLECTTGCTTASNWSSAFIDSSVDSIRPGIATVGALRSVAYQAGGLYYAQCTSGCDTAGGWSSKQIDGVSAQKVLVAAIFDGGTALNVEVLTDEGHFFDCHQSDCSMGGFSKSGTNMGTTDTGLALIPGPLAVIAGTANGNLKLNACPTLPCNNGGWPTNPPAIAMNVKADQIAMSASAGLFEFLYTDSVSGQIQQELIGADGGLAAPLLACGQPLAGRAISQDFAADGGTSVLYVTGSELRFHAP